MSRFAAVTLAIALASCSRDPVRATVERLYASTTSAQTWTSTLVYTREPAVVTASWELNPTMLWTPYVQSIRSRIEADGFMASSTTPSAVVFRRTLDGDVQVLQLHASTESTPIRVMATFSSRAF